MWVVYWLMSYFISFCRVVSKWGLRDLVVVKVFIM